MLSKRHNSLFLKKKRVCVYRNSAETCLIDNETLKRTQNPFSQNKANWNQTLPHRTIISRIKCKKTKRKTKN